MDAVYYPDDVRYYLKNEFEIRLKRRPHYSLRAFARDLELSPSTLSDFFNNKIGFSKPRIYQISKKLNFTPVQRDHWWDLVEARFARDPSLRKLAKIRAQAKSRESKNRLTLEQFQFISEWQHLAILELVEMSSRYHNAEELAEALGLSLKIVKDSISRLQKLGMLVCDHNPWQVSNESTVIDDENSSKAIQFFHGQILQKVAQSLDTQESEKRDSQSIIFGVSKECLPAFKAELRSSLVNIILKYAQTENKNSLYCMSAHLFSLTQKESL